jgi:hypothetical protein
MFLPFKFSIQFFSHVFFIVQKWPLYVNFSMPFCAKWRFSQGSIRFVSMRFCGHVPNSPKNKNVKRLIPYVFQKMVFLGSKTLMSPLDTGEKNLFFNFERYDLVNGKEWVSKTLWTCRHTSSVKDLMVGSTKKYWNFTKSTLLLVGAVLKQFSWKTPFGCLGVNP